MPQDRKFAAWPYLGIPLLPGIPVVVAAPDWLRPAADSVFKNPLDQHNRVHGVRQSRWKFLAFVAACVAVLALPLAILAQ